MRSSERSRGFSLVELLVVVVIMLVVTAISVPTILRGLRQYGLSNAARETSDLIQQTRYEAIRLNRNLSVRAQPQGTRTLAWIDRDGDATPDADEPSMLTADGIIYGPPLAPGPSSTGFPQAQAPTGQITFNSRGTVDYGGGPNVIYFLTMGYSNQPTYGFRAITLTPMGKSKLWSAAASGQWHD